MIDVGPFCSDPLDAGPFLNRAVDFIDLAVTFCNAAERNHSQCMPEGRQLTTRNQHPRRQRLIV